MQAEHSGNDLRTLLARAQEPQPPAEREATLHDLIRAHDAVVDRDEAAAEELRKVFLFGMRDVPTVLDDPALRSFVTHCLTPDLFAKVKWESPEQVIGIAEILYAFRFQDELAPEQIDEYVRELLRNALRSFEREGAPDKMFALLQQAPILSTMMDGELLRFRNQVYLYEVRRVQRTRRVLYGYLALTVVLTLVVFPFLFIHYENGTIRAAIEETANVDLPSESRQNLSYFDGVYWAVITAASIGYGDIVPVTLGGKILSLILGSMGVISIGVLAGLILNLVTPRSLD